MPISIRAARPDEAERLTEVAYGFYLKLGARIIGEVVSERQGRTLNLFRYSRSYAKSAD